MLCRTMVYVEGDATYRKLVSEEGKEQWALGVVQRGMYFGGTIPKRSRETIGADLFSF